MSTTFHPPVEIRLDGNVRAIASAKEAAALLADVNWPGERGPAHRDAYETCLKVMEGNRSAADGRQRFFEAAAAAGLVVEQ